MITVVGSSNLLFLLILTVGEVGERSWDSACLHMITHTVHFNMVTRCWMKAYCTPLEMVLVWVWGNLSIWMFGLFCFVALCCRVCRCSDQICYPHRSYCGYLCRHRVCHVIPMSQPCAHVFFYYVFRDWNTISHFQTFY